MFVRVSESVPIANKTLRKTMRFLKRKLFLPMFVVDNGIGEQRLQVVLPHIYNKHDQVLLRKQDLKYKAEDYCDYCEEMRWEENKGTDWHRLFELNSEYVRKLDLEIKDMTTIPHDELITIFISYENELFVTNSAGTYKPFSINEEMRHRKLFDNWLGREHYCTDDDGWGDGWGWCRWE